MKMCPEAKIDDGLLDITYVQNVPPEKVPELLQTLAMGGRDNDDLAESIKTMRVPWLEVVSTFCPRMAACLVVDAVRKALHIASWAAQCAAMTGDFSACWAIWFWILTFSALAHPQMVLARYSSSKAVILCAAG